MSSGSRLASLAHRCYGRFDHAEAFESQCPDLSAARPFDELELGHDVGLDEVGIARRRPDGEGILVHGERLELRVELVQGLFREARPALARVDKFSVLVITDRQRAGISPALAL